MNHLDGSAYSLTGTTGTMAASLAANSVVFAMQASPTDTTRPNTLPRAPIEIESLRITFTGIVASVVPVLQGRALQLFKASTLTQAAPTGGAALTAAPKWLRDQGADTGLAMARISTTTGLTLGGFTLAATPMATIDLSAAATAGGQAKFEYLSRWHGSPIWLDPGDFLAISNPAAFDALLTWQLSVNVDYRRRDAI